MSTDPRYPIGKFSRPTKPLTDSERESMIAAIAETPGKLRAAAKGLTDAQVDTPYRDGGWTLRQVLHHVPDSHMNAYCRFKLALTEDNPTIRPYDEKAWAELGDAKSKLITDSLNLLDALHARWVLMLKNMKPADFERKLVHPEMDAPLTLDFMLALYAWHGKHHTAHITSLRKIKGW